MEYKNRLSNRKLSPYQKSIFSGVLAIFSLVFIPAIASAQTTTTVVSSTLSPVISLLTSNGTVNVNAIPTSGGVQTIASDTVTVSTNDSAGYTLKLGETGVATALTNGGNTIPASSGTQSSPVAEAVNTWGYRVDGAGGFGSGPTSGASNQAISGTTFAAVAASGAPNTIATTSTTASNATTTVWYGLAVNTTTPNGTYTNSVTYTATAN
jgi:hypothetical protein